MEMAQRAVPAAVTLIVFTTLALFVVSLRLYTRAVVVKNVGADDYLMIGAVVSFPWSLALLARLPPSASAPIPCIPRAEILSVWADPGRNTRIASN